VVDEALALALLSRSKEAAGEKKKPLITWFGQGLQAGVELDSNAALADLMKL
jgi:hypothetical protein